MAKKKQPQSSKNQFDLFSSPEKEKRGSSYTEEQKEYIEYWGKDSILLLSTAGSGKTFSSVERLKFLLEKGVDPSKMIFFSFTNAATEELKKRIGRDDIDIRTIHSFCGKVLIRLQKGKAIVSFYDFINWFKKSQKPTSGYPADTEEFEEIVTNLYEDSQYFESHISSYKLQRADGMTGVRVPEYWSLYIEFLRETKSRDFSDMLIEVRDLFKEDRYLNLFKNKYDYIFVDEYQDTSTIQMEILLALNAKNYYLIGDRNQSIYGYGSSSCSKVESMLRNRRNVREMNLTTNFRSDKIIIENSNKHSNLVAIPFSKDEGYINKKILYTIDGLIDVLSGKGEIAVLVRTNAVIKKIELELLKRKVPIRYFNYITKSELEAYKNNKLTIQTKSKLDSLKKYFDGSIPSLIAFLKSCENSNKFITTIHKSKGLEFETCVVVNSISPDVLEDNGILSKLTEKQLTKISFDPNDVEDNEAKNVHYVAVSRSKHKLFYMVYDF